MAQIHTVHSVTQKQIKIKSPSIFTAYLSRSSLNKSHSSIISSHKICFIFSFIYALLQQLHYLKHTYFPFVPIRHLTHQEVIRILNQYAKDQQYSTVVEYLLSMHRGLGSTSSTHLITRPQEMQCKNDANYRKKCTNPKSKERYLTQVLLTYKMETGAQ